VRKQFSQIFAVILVVICLLKNSFLFDIKILIAIFAIISARKYEYYPK